MSKQMPLRRTAHSLLTLLPPQILLRRGLYRDSIFCQFLKHFIVIMFHVSCLTVYFYERVLPNVPSIALAIHWEWSGVMAEFLPVSKGLLLHPLQQMAIRCQETSATCDIIGATRVISLLFQDKQQIVHLCLRCIITFKYVPRLGT